MNLPRSIAWLLAFLGGQLLALCYPPYNVGVMVWFWLLPLLGAIWFGGRGSARRGFGIAWAGGLGFWLFNVKWIAAVEGVPPVLGFVFLLLLASFLALYFAAWGAVASKWVNPFRVSAMVPEEEKSSVQEKVRARLQKKKKGVSTWKLAQVSLSRAFVLAALWVSLEWVRGWFLTGFTWSGVGIAFHDSLVLAQGADLVGATGLAFLPVFVSVVLLQVGIRLVQENRIGRRRAHLDFGFAVLLIALSFIYGIVRTSQFHKKESYEFDLLVVQGNVAQTLKWDPDEQYALYEKYSDLTKEGIDRVHDQAVQGMKEGEVISIPKVDMVLWPESSFPEPVWYQGEDILPDQYNELYVDNHLRQLGDFVFATGINYLPAVTDDEGQILLTAGEPFYNSMSLMEGEFKDMKVYHKKHLVPFGEYMPLEDQVPLVRSLFKLSTQQDYVDSFSRGSSVEPVSILLREQEVQIIPTICYEDTVSSLVRQLVRPAPQIILNVTNDGWFGESEAALQHYATAKFRAIELRRPLVRSANTGVSGVIQASGSEYPPGRRDQKQIVVDEEGSPFVAGSIYAKVWVPKEGVMTVYGYLGNWFIYLCLGVSVFYGIFEVAKSRRFLS